MSSGLAFGCPTSGLVNGKKELQEPGTPLLGFAQVEVLDVYRGIFEE